MEFLWTSQMLLTPKGLISQLQKKSRSRMLAERLSGELFGLTSGCDPGKEGVTVTYSGRQPNNRLSNPEVRSQPPHCD